MSAATEEFIRRKLARRGQTIDAAGNVTSTKPAVDAESSADGDGLGQESDIAKDDAALTPQPAAVAPTTQPRDWEAEYLRLQQDHQALQGRLAPVQRDVESFRVLADANRSELDRYRNTADSELSDLRRQLSEATTRRKAESIQEQIDELLDEDDRANLDPAVIKALSKIAGGLFASQKTPDTTAAVEAALATRELKNVDAHRRSLMADTARPVSKLYSLANDPTFIDYCQEHPEVDLAISSLLSASDKAAVDKLARVADRLISGFEAGKVPPAKQPDRAPDPRGGTDLLRNAMQRTPTKLSEEELRKLANEHKYLTRTRDPKHNGRKSDIMKILDQHSRM
jgi:hypothetical protein